MRIYEVPVVDIVIPKNRQRKEFDADKLLELAGSITENGLIHPIGLRKEDGQYFLVTGERRLRALDYIWQFGDPVKCGEKIFPPEIVPCILWGELDSLESFAIEYEENVQRTDLTWQEIAENRAILMDLRTKQAVRDNKPPPTVADITKEVSNAEDPVHSKAYTNVRQDLILSEHLDDPDIAAAPSREKAFKILQRKEERRRNEALGASIDPLSLSSLHRMLRGNSLEILPQMREGEFDVILTDPPYGMGADKFGDSGGRTPGAHAYQDSYEGWKPLAKSLASEGFRITKSMAHAYVFCDSERFLELRTIFEKAGWTTFRTPLIWVNPSAMRAPWPEQGPQRKYQMLLYALKGGKPVTKLYPDVLTYPTDENLGHAAQKPLALYLDLLKRSVRPGDSVIDPFAGSGTIFPAAHELKCAATGIEIDDGSIGIASKRIKELK